MSATPQLMQMVMAMIQEKPIEVLAKKRCEELKKDLEKMAKTKTADEIAKSKKQIAKTIVCGKAEELGKDVTKFLTTEGKKKLKEADKKIEKDIKKKGGEGNPKALPLTDLRNLSQDKQRKGDLIENGKLKAIEMEKPKGNVIHAEVSIPVMSKDNIKLSITVMIGIDRDAFKKPKDNEKRGVQPYYGIIGISGKFGPKKKGK